MAVVWLVVFSLLLFAGVLYLSLPPDIKSVPKIIHQLAPADRSKWPDVWFQCQESWRQMYPDYKYILWTDEKMDEFMKKEFPDYYGMYQAYEKNIHRIDAVRCFILYKYGGIYADMDIEVLRDFMPVIPKTEVSIVESPYKQNENCQNALMISPPYHPFWKRTFEELRKSARYKNILDVAGPRMIDRAMKGWSIHVLPYRNFNPNKNVKLTEEELKNIYTRHYGTCVYMQNMQNNPKSNDIKRKQVQQ